MRALTRQKFTASALHHDDWTITYPMAWEDEYIRTGMVAAWFDSFPDLLSGYLDARGRLNNPGSRALLAQYGLMYLLRCEGLHSITWLDIGANYKKPTKNQVRLDSQFAIMDCWMGSERFAALRTAILASDLGSWRGEPDLFCWNPDTQQWLFAEAKGRGDKLGPSQFEWFQVCRNACPDAEIRVYSLKAA